MDDLGAPISFLTLPKGVPVYASDGEEIGKVEYVLSAPNVDIFDGIVLDTSVLPGGSASSMLPRSPRLRARCGADDRCGGSRTCPSRAPIPGRLTSTPPTSGGGRQSKLRRAWDMISGKG